MLQRHCEIARETISSYHECRIMSYTDIMNGIKKYIDNYSDKYGIIGELNLNDEEEILSMRDEYSNALHLGDMYIIPVNVILKFWEKYATPDEICKEIIQWYFEKYRNGYTLIFKS